MNIRESRLVKTVSFHFVFLSVAVNAKLDNQPQELASKTWTKFLPPTSSARGWYEAYHNRVRVAYVKPSSEELMTSAAIALHGESEAIRHCLDAAWQWHVEAGGDDKPYVWA